MDIRKFQQEVLKVFSEMDKMPSRRAHTKQSAFIHLMEEMGEIARQITSEYHRPEKFNRDNLATELADVMMFIVLLAKLYDVDLSKELEESIERVKGKIEHLSNQEGNRRL